MLDDSQRLPSCSIGRAMEILGERWSLLILRECFYGVKRFSVMQRNLGIARNILSSRLQLLPHRHPRAPPLPGGARALRVQAHPIGARPVSRRGRDHALGRRAPLRRRRPGGAAPPLRRARRPRARLRALSRRAGPARRDARAGARRRAGRTLDREGAEMTVQDPTEQLWGEERRPRRSRTSRCRASACPSRSCAASAGSRARPRARTPSSGSRPGACRADRRRRRPDRARRARRPVPDRRLPDRFRHLVEHECERGDRQARGRGRAPE